MPPVQKTFTIIPQGPSLAAGPGAGQHSIRPMTSKQVRKAYKAAHQGPSMSRAERIKWERAEQERIRKEFEKEKAAVKAKAARERKKEKELAEREQRRREGLPLVTVRPSQDLIARFVRGNGSGKKRDSAGLGLDEKSACHLSVIEEVKSREHALNEERLPDQGQGNEMMEPVLADGLERSPVLGEGSARTGMDDFCADIGEDYEGRDDDKIKTFSIVEERPQGFHAVTDSPIADATEDDTSLLNAKLTAVTPEACPQETTTRRNQPEKKIFPEIDLIAEWDDSELEMLAMEAISQHTMSHPTDSEDRYCRPPKPSSNEKDLGIDTAFILDACCSDPPPAKPPDREEHAMGPPPLPVPQPFRRSQSSPMEQHPQLPPLSTQAIFSNVDDFFPTASQLELELEEDTQSTPRKSSPLPDLVDPLVDEQPSCHVSKFDSTSDRSESSKFTDLLLATPLHCHGATCSQIRQHGESVQKRARTTCSKAPRIGKPAEPSLHPHMMRCTNQPKQLLYLAEKKLAAIRQAIIPPKPSPKPRKATRNHTLKPMISSPSPKVSVKPPPISLPPTTQKRAPPTTNHDKVEKMATSTTAFTPTANKANILPPAEQTEIKNGLHLLPTASQESYGGDWVDEAALELMV